MMIKDPIIQEIVDFSMSAQGGKYADGQWEIKELIQVKTQVVAGMNYNVVAELTDHTTSSGIYEMTVWKKLYSNENGEGFSLTKFEVLYESDIS